MFFPIAFSFAVGVASAQSVPADTDSKPISGPQFVLSDEAAAAGIEGKIVVAFEVNKEGKVTIIVPYAGPSWPCGTKPIKQLEDMWEAIKQNVRASRPPTPPNLLIMNADPSQKPIFFEGMVSRGGQARL